MARQIGQVLARGAGFAHLLGIAAPQQYVMARREGDRLLVDTPLGPYLFTAVSATAMVFAESGASATFTTAGPHAAVVHVDEEEIGRARFYLMEGVEEGLV